MFSRRYNGTRFQPRGLPSRQAPEYQCPVRRFARSFVAKCRTYKKFVGNRPQKIAGFRRRIGNIRRFGFRLSNRIFNRRGYGLRRFGFGSFARFLRRAFAFRNPFTFGSAFAFGYALLLGNFSELTFNFRIKSVFLFLDFAFQRFI